MNTTCCICGDSADHAMFQAKEMMFGSGELFPYAKCSECGCLQILDIPADMARYYPAGYYSFRVTVPLTPNLPPLKKAMKAWRLDAAFGGANPIGHLLLAFVGRPELPAGIEGLGLRASDKILDIGCGNGSFLAHLRHAGFRSLTGIDPFLPEDHACLEGINLLRADVSRFDGKFDSVFIQHTLEHMPEQEETLRHLRRLTAAGGKVIVRIPITGSPAESRYGTDWVQWDAPRHLFIHSTQSMAVLCERTGLEIARVIHDSSEFCLLGSEQYRRGVSLEAKGSWAVDREKNMFSPREISLCRRIALRMNRLGRGDQATFILKPI